MDNTITILSAISCFILIVIGLIGVILPLLPGVPLAWLGIFIYALATGFNRISIITTIVFFVITMMSILVDFIVPLLGAKGYKASKLGLLGVFIGFIIGIFIFGPWGIIIGPLLGALVGELISGRTIPRAFKSALGALIGFIAGSLLKVIIIFIMLGFFIASLF